MRREWTGDQFVGGAFSSGYSFTGRDRPSPLWDTKPVGELGSSRHFLNNPNSCQSLFKSSHLARPGKGEMMSERKYVVGPEKYRFSGISYSIFKFHWFRKASESHKNLGKNIRKLFHQLLEVECGCGQHQIDTIAFTAFEVVS